MFKKLLVAGMLVMMLRTAAVSSASWDSKPKPNSSTLLYLPLDENSGTKAKDASGNMVDEVMISETAKKFEDK